MTDSLWFSWSPAPGDFDFYELILYNPNGTKKENWKDKDLTEWRFHGLVPGRKYTLCVITHSGDLSNRATGESRTGKKLSYQWPSPGGRWLPQACFNYDLINKKSNQRCAMCSAPNLGRVYGRVDKGDRLWVKNSWVVDIAPPT